MFYSSPCAPSGGCGSCGSSVGCCDGVVVNVGGDGSVFDPTTIDFSALTPTQKDAIKAIVGTPAAGVDGIAPTFDMSTITQAQKDAIKLIVGAGTGTGADGVGPAFDMSTLTAAQKAAVTAFVSSGIDFAGLSTAQKDAIRAIAGVGAGGAFDPTTINFAALTPAQKAAIASIANPPSGVDGIAPTFDMSTLTQAQKDAIKAFVGPDGVGPAFDFSTLTAAQKAQIQALVPSTPLTQPALGAAIVAAPTSSAANPLVEVLGNDASGTPAVATFVPLAKTTGTVVATSPIGGIIGTNVTELAKATAPKAGRYMVNYKAGYAVAPTATEPQGATKVIDASLYVSAGGAGNVMQNFELMNAAATAPVVPSSNYSRHGVIVAVGSAGPVDLIAGDSVKISLYIGVPTTAGFVSAISSTEYFPPAIELVEVPSKQIQFV